MARRLGPQSARPVRDCLHVRARHEHGTRPAYVFDGCRCSACCGANTAEERRRSTAIVYGTWSALIDATRARQHVQALREAGLSLERTAVLSGVGQGAISSLVYGLPARNQPPPARIRADTERRLLAVQFDPSEVADGRRVDATGTRRRLQALATLGWSVPPLAVRSGLTARTLRRTLTNGAVTAETARAVSALYDQLQTASAPRRTPQEPRRPRRRSPGLEELTGRGPQPDRGAVTDTLGRPGRDGHRLCNPVRARAAGLPPPQLGRSSQLSEAEGVFPEVAYASDLPLWFPEDHPAIITDHSRHRPHAVRKQTRSRSHVHRRLLQPVEHLVSPLSDRQRDPAVGVVGVWIEDHLHATIIAPISPLGFSPNGPER